MYTPRSSDENEESEEDLEDIGNRGYVLSGEEETVRSTASSTTKQSSGTARNVNIKTKTDNKDSDEIGVDANTPLAGSLEHDR